MDVALTSTVLVRPADWSLELENGETLFVAAARHGLRWPTICGGLGTCHTCFVTVEEGQDRCAPMLALELEGIQALGRPVDGRTRLACQLTATGPIVVTKRGVHRIEG